MTESKPKSKHKTILTDLTKKEKLIVSKGWTKENKVAALRCLTEMEGRLLKTETIQDGITILKEILPYWITHQHDYPIQAEYLLAVTRYWLVAYRSISDREIPPIPSDLLGIQDWITDVERALAKVNTEEQSKPLTMKDWGKILELSPNKLREIRQSKNPKYHFQQVSPRRWTLPKSELPTEYLEKFRPELKAAKEQ
jgi:hypothetical protein